MKANPNNTVVLVPAYNPPVIECQLGLDALRDAGWVIHQKLQHPNVDIARAGLAAEALADPNTQWLLWIDSDMDFELKQVLQLAEARMPFAAAPYFLPKSGKLAFEPIGLGGVVFGQKGDLVKASRVGLGFALTHRSIYENLHADYPCQSWWQVPLCTHNGEKIRPYFSSATIPPNKDGELPHATGDDYGFCARVIASGQSIWCDTRLFVGHVGRKVYGLSDAVASIRAQSISSAVATHMPSLHRVSEPQTPAGTNAVP